MSTGVPTRPGSSDGPALGLGCTGMSGFDALLPPVSTAVGDSNPDTSTTDR